MKKTFRKMAVTAAAMSAMVLVGVAVVQAGYQEIEPNFSWGSGECWASDCICGWGPQ